MPEPTREVLWNIDYAWIMYALAAAAVGVLAWSIVVHIRRWRIGRPSDRGGHFWRRAGVFVRTSFIDLILHRRILGAERPFRPKEIYPGLAHFFIFSGFIVLFIATVLDAASHYLVDFMQGDFYRGYSLVTDIFGILLIIGVMMAFIRRYVNKPARLDNRPDDLITLCLLLVITLSGFAIEGLRISAIELQAQSSWTPWSPGGYLFSRAFSGAGKPALLGWHRGLWWSHAILTLGGVTYVALSGSRLFHVIWDPANVFFRKLSPKGALAKIDFDKTERFGAGKIEDFTWKQLLDLDACTRCGRCQDACPAYSSGKALNPKRVILDLKNHLYDVYPALRAAASRKEMAGEVIADEVAWDCTTCRACEQACPVYIEHVDKIIDLRRNLAMEKSRLPEAAQEALKSLGTRGHPYRGAAATRTTWLEGLEVPKPADTPDAEILFWVGCSSALEDRNMNIARATVKVLRAAGVKFAVLGEYETCCGDPARRLGDEYLFQNICGQNIETFKRYNVKKIVTACPHCFNSFKNEYPQFGGAFTVIHNAQYLAGLIGQGRLKIGNKTPGKVAYSDSCYLGRYNDIYREPRSIVEALSESYVELPRHGSNAFCCGGGGGHMWMEEPPDKRVNHRRADEIIAAGVDCVATACPYCLTMLEDGLKTKQADDKVKALDISEIIAEALD
jgi:Fe-S oxidoreductase